MLSCCQKTWYTSEGRILTGGSFLPPETRSLQHGSYLKLHVTIRFLRQEAIVAHLAEYGGEQEAERKQHAK